MINSDNKNNGLIISILIMTLAIGTEYFSRSIFLLLIGAILGLFWIVANNKLTKRDIYYFTVLIIVHFGVITAKLFFTPEISMFINILFVIQLLLFSLIFFVFFRNHKLPGLFFVLTSFFYLPHALGLLLHIIPLVPGQFGILTFGGFYKDPNYLSPDLLFSLLSQLFILKMKFSKSLKFVTYINIIATIYLILLTGSRTAALSLILILLLYLLIVIVNKKSFIKKLLMPVIIILFIGSFGNSVLQGDNRISYIYDRFTKSGKGSNLLENERWYVWGISYDVINNGELFKGYGINNFLSNQYQFVSHNVFLDAGIKYGKYTFYSHIIFVLISILLFAEKFIRKIYKYNFNIPTYMFIFSLSQLLIMNSISVSQKHLYWFVILVLLSFGWFRPIYFNEKTYTDQNN